MTLIDLLSTARLLGRHDHERTWSLERENRRLVIKAFRGPAQIPTSAKLRLPQVSGLVPWLHFLSLDAEMARALGLKGAHWRLGIRSHVPGRSLAQLEHENLENWRNQALELAIRVRDLHDRGVVHGDLHPGNVVLDEEGNLWLIDLAIFEVDLETEHGHVLGSAPFMAPELWEGHRPNRSSDAYALGTLIHSMATGIYPRQADSLATWAQAHQDAPHVSQQLGPRLGPILARMLAIDPGQRSPLQELIDALEDEGALPCMPWIGPVAAFHDPVLDELLEGLRQDSFSALILDGSPRTGKTHLLRSLAQRAELDGRRVIRVDDDGIHGAAGMLGLCSEQPLRTGPFATLLSLIDIAHATSANPSTGPIELSPGDRLHIFEELAMAMLGVLDEQDVLILWDDLHRAGPDVQAWWGFFLEKLRRRQSSSTVTVKLVATTRSGAGDVGWGVHRLKQIPSANDWNRWRATSLRPEVRDLAQGRWKAILDRHLHEPEALLEALNEEIRAKKISLSQALSATSATTGDTDIRRLFEEGAYYQVAQACHRQVEQNAQGNEEALLEFLELWTKAVYLASGDQDQTAPLEEALRGARGLESLRLEASLLLAKHLYQLGRHREGLEVLDEEAETIAPDSALARIRLEAWRAQLNLSSGQVEQAGELARVGLEAWENAEPEERDQAFVEGLQLRVLEGAARAFGSDALAMDELRALAPELASARVPAILRARCHAYRAFGLTRQDELDGATDAYLRALEEVETAGLDGELPLYLLNVGTAYHRQGRLGLAREYYARGSRIAQPTTRASTRALLYA
ncbi:MAG: protein kinase domain-containing protein, partial [Bradymonadaceae bacterium]